MKEDRAILREPSVCRKCGGPIRLRLKPLRLRDFYMITLVVAITGLVAVRAFEMGVLGFTVCFWVLLLCAPPLPILMRYAVRYGWVRACKRCRPEVPRPWGPPREALYARRAIYAFVICTFIFFLILMA